MSGAVDTVLWPAATGYVIREQVIASSTYGIAKACRIKGDGYTPKTDPGEALKAIVK